MDYGKLHARSGNLSLTGGDYFETPASSKEERGPSTGDREAFRQILGELVPAILRDENGGLDLRKVPAKSFEELRDFLADQASLNDGKSFRNPYQSLLRRDKYESLLRGLYSSGPIDPDLFLAFQGELIEIDAGRYVHSRLSSKPGREQLKVILRDARHFSKGNRAEVAKEIARSADADKLVTSLEVRGVTDKISLWNYFNIFISDADLSEASQSAEDILKSAEFFYDQVEKATRNKPIKPGSHDPLKQVQENLEGLLYELNNDRYWPEHQYTNETIWHFDSNSVRDEAISRTKALFEKSKKVTNSDEIKALNQEIQVFLKGSLGAGDAPDKAHHLTLGNGMEQLFAAMPAEYKKSYESLKQQSDKWHYSVEMGENINLAQPQDASKTRLIAQLENTKHELWYGYKQHKAISRLISNIADGFGSGDIQDIRKANRFLDEKIEAIGGAKNPDELKQTLESLQVALKKDGSLFKAFEAVEMDGTEQVLGLAQTCAEMIAIAAVTDGIGLIGEGAHVVKTTRALSRAEKLITGAADGFGRGMAISTAENTVALATQEVSQGDDTALSWVKDAMATGLAMTFSSGISKAFIADEAAKETLIREIAKRYATGGLKAARHLAVDAGMEGAEEILDAIARQALDGKTEAMSLDQITEILSISFAGGGIQQGIGHARNAGGGFDAAIGGWYSESDPFPATAIAFGMVFPVGKDASTSGWMENGPLVAMLTLGAAIYFNGKRDSRPEVAELKQWTGKYPYLAQKILYSDFGVERVLELYQLVREIKDSEVLGEFFEHLPGLLEYLDCSGWPMNRKVEFSTALIQSIASNRVRPKFEFLSNVGQIDCMLREDLSMRRRDRQTILWTLLRKGKHGDGFQVAKFDKAIVTMLKAEWEESDICEALMTAIAGERPMKLLGELIELHQGYDLDLEIDENPYERFFDLDIEPRKSFLFGVLESGNPAERIALLRSLLEHFPNHSIEQILSVHFLLQDHMKIAAKEAFAKITQTFEEAGATLPEATSAAIKLIDSAYFQSHPRGQLLLAGMMRTMQVKYPGLIWELYREFWENIAELVVLMVVHHRGNESAGWEANKNTVLNFVRATFSLSLDLFRKYRAEKKAVFSKRVDENGAVVEGELIQREALFVEEILDDSGSSSKKRPKSIFLQVDGRLGPEFFPALMEYLQSGRKPAFRQSPEFLESGVLPNLRSMLDLDLLETPSDPLKTKLLNLITPPDDGPVKEAHGKVVGHKAGFLLPLVIGTGLGALFTPAVAEAAVSANHFQSSGNGILLGLGVALAGLIGATIFQGQKSAASAEVEELKSWIDKYPEVASAFLFSGLEAQDLLEFYSLIRGLEPSAKEYFFEVLPDYLKFLGRTDWTHDERVEFSLRLIEEILLDDDGPMFEFLQGVEQIDAYLDAALRMDAPTRKRVLWGLLKNSYWGLGFRHEDFQKVMSCMVAAGWSFEQLKTLVEEIVQYPGGDAIFDGLAELYSSWDPKSKGPTQHLQPFDALSVDKQHAMILRILRSTNSSDKLRFLGSLLKYIPGKELSEVEAVVRAAPSTLDWTDLRALNKYPTIQGELQELIWQTLEEGLEMENVAELLAALNEKKFPSDIVAIQGAFRGALSGAGLFSSEVHGRYRVVRSREGYDFHEISSESTQVGRKYRLQDVQKIYSPRQLAELMRFMEEMAGTKSESDRDGVLEVHSLEAMLILRLAIGVTLRHMRLLREFFPETFGRIYKPWVDREAWRRFIRERQKLGED